MPFASYRSHQYHTNTEPGVQALMLSTSSRFLHICIIFHAGNRSRRKVFVLQEEAANTSRIRFDDEEGPNPLELSGVYKGSPYIDRSLVRAFCPSSDQGLP